nr:oxidative stress-induced growth inhibitor 1 [Odocoileus virginianus texanus]XP_020770749.1 oxidative stress-induced growth inhibitor 1 [Odocoileus virginianus texanus]XP_020770750.1 oxidative stress-induced growth inhibitor 1 [Odocoileus virginianus texanus]XP_020770751.1 oxidative stress-induced growth inhibitor 1 [Odocoileus virginianus texanus]
MSNRRKDHLGASSSEPLPVIIIGNGPSGICLSYLLSGYTPYVRPDAIHPHPLLQRKLSEAPGVSIMDQVGLSSGTGVDTPTAGKLSQAKIKKLHLWEFPASPLVRTQCFHCRAQSLIPGQRSRIPQATWHSQETKGCVCETWEATETGKEGWQLRRQLASPPLVQRF